MVCLANPHFLAACAWESPSVSRADLIRLGRVLSLAMMDGFRRVRNNFPLMAIVSAGGRARGVPALFFVGRLQLSYMWSYGQQIMMSPKISQCSRRGWRVANVCCWTRTGNCWIARLSCRFGSPLSRGFSLTRSARSRSRRSCRKAPRGLSRRAVNPVSQARYLFWSPSRC